MCCGPMVFRSEDEGSLGMFDLYIPVLWSVEWKSSLANTLQGSFPQARVHQATSLQAAYDVT